MTNARTKEKAAPARSRVHTSSYAREYVGTEKLKNKVAVIGGEDLITGHAAATLCAREGARVVLAYPRAQQAKAESIQQVVKTEGGKTLLLEGDIHNHSFTEFVAEHTVDEYGAIDILINTTAVSRGLKDIESTSYEQWDQGFQKNIYGYFSMVKSALPYLTKNASIINTNPIVTSEESFNFITAQKAVHALTKSLADHLKSKDIRVNCVTPGSVPRDGLTEEGIREAMEKYLEKIAPVFVFLASNIDSAYITGEILNLSDEKIS